MQSQFTTLLAWKRLRQKEASIATDVDQEKSSDEPTPSPSIGDGAGEGASQGASDDAPVASTSSSSQVLNLVTTDLARIVNKVDMLTFAIMGPLEVLAGGYSSYYLLGNGALIGLAVAALLQPIALYLGHITKNIDEKLQQSRDKRVSLLSEAIKAIRIVKYEAWEDEMAAKIMVTRRQELKCQAQSWVIYTFFGSFFVLTPILTIVVSLGWYVLVDGNKLTASVAFPAVAVLVELRFAISYLPNIFLTSIQAWVSMKRIAAYLETGEVDIPAGTFHPGASSASTDDLSALGRVCIREAEITWPSDGLAKASTASSTVSLLPELSETPKIFTLSIPDTAFETGKTNLVCGKIGSGKTLLLLSLLGEAELVLGHVECPRSHLASSLFANKQASRLATAAPHQRGK